jgi:succinate dehydrogenase / fumarate reductase cytochrome b subunit
MKPASTKGMHLANVTNAERPLSPHLGIYKWGPSMAASIIHRVTGSGMATLGTLVFVWWLVAIAAGNGAYDQFLDVFTYKTGHLNALGYILGVGFTWALFQHMCSGARHFFLDVGANFELKSNKNTALFTFIAAVTLTVGFWLLILEKAIG